MSNEEFIGRKPDFKGEIPVAAWLNKDSDGNSFISVAIGSRVRLEPARDEVEKEIENIFD
jgi:hypothetical protein